MHIILFGIYLYNECYANVGKGRRRSISETTYIFLREGLADVLENVEPQSKFKDIFSFQYNGSPFPFKDIFSFQFNGYPFPFLVEKLCFFGDYIRCVLLHNIVQKTFCFHLYDISISVYFDFYLVH